MKTFLPGRALSTALSIFIPTSISPISSIVSSIVSSITRILTVPLTLVLALPITVASIGISSSTYAAEADNDELRPFSSDGCSSFPDGTFSQNELWLSCCIAHDYSYWKGGTYSERQQTDIELQSCVAEVGEPEIAALMLIGVRVGGSPFWPTQFRWGYGWSYPHFYGTLTEEELAQITAQGYEQGEEAEIQ